MNTIIILIALIAANKDSIWNPANEEYVQEIAFNLDIEPEEVTQEQFNARYCNQKKL